MHAYLLEKGLKVAKIHGGVPPRERKRIMNQVKNLDFEYIVATDLAARGIDIEGVSHVINDAIPQDLSFFVHRVFLHSNYYTTKTGYEKKIKWAVDEKRRKAKRAENRARGRAERKAKRQTF